MAHRYCIVGDGFGLPPAVGLRYSLAVKECLAASHDARSDQ